MSLGEIKGGGEFLFPSDNVIQVYAPTFNPLIWSFGSPENLKVTPDFFKSSDMNKLKSLDHVEYVEGVANPNNGIGKNVPLASEMNFSDLNYSRYGMEEYLDESTVTDIEETICSDTARVNNNGKSSCLIEKEDLLIGNFPEDFTDEIDLDFRLAISKANELDLDNLQDLIGKKIEIRGNDDVLEYTVAGIIKPDSFVSLRGVTNVTGYSEASFSGHPWKFEGEDGLTAEEQALGILSAGYDAVGLVPQVEDIVPLKDNAYPGFYIEVDDPSNVKEVVRELKQYDPNLYILSNYTMKHTNNFQFMKYYYFKKIIEQIIIFVVLIVLLYLTLSVYKKSLKGTENKLLEFGFSLGEVNRFVNLDRRTLIQGILIASLMVLIIFMLISNFHLVTTLLTLTNILIFVLLTLIILRRKNERKK